jgi:hypothetical protein
MSVSSGCTQETRSTKEQQQHPTILSDDRSNTKGGVHRKRFEHVVAHLLLKIHPLYRRLPPVPTMSSSSSATTTTTTTTKDWPYHSLPAAARVFGNGRGQLSDQIRAQRKEDQVRSMLRCIIPLIPLPSSSSSSESSAWFSYTIVDFGGGTGHLSIPLALLFPNCTVICVDLGQHSLDLLHAKATRCGNRLQQRPPVQDRSPNDDATRSVDTVPPVDGSYVDPNNRGLCSTAIPNLLTYHGAAHTFTDHPFQMAVALHLCGEGTDVVLHLAGVHDAKAIIVAPCCVGKLSGTAHNPYVYQATGSNIPTIQYPQSTAFRHRISTADDWNALVQAADYGGGGDRLDDTPVVVEQSHDDDNDHHHGTGRNAIRRTAKALLETDRCYYLQETYGYEFALVRMEPWDATPKHDIIVAWSNSSNINYNDRRIDATIDDDCQKDIEVTVAHLLDLSSSTVLPSNLPNHGCSNSLRSTTKHHHNCVDWSIPEEEQIRQQLMEFMAASAPHNHHDDHGRDHHHPSSSSTTTTMVFPTRMGARRRKMIHFVAEELGLSHWGLGNKHADKTVAVAFYVSMTTEPTSGTNMIHEKKT